MLLKKYQGFYSVVPLGFEPGPAEPKSDVLPLHHGTIIYLLSLKSGCKDTILFLFHKGKS